MCHSKINYSNIIMKLDLHYLKYELKGYLISDFKSREIMELLNDLEPEKYLQEYVLSLKLQDENKEKVRQPNHTDHDHRMK